MREKLGKGWLGGRIDFVRVNLLARERKSLNLSSPIRLGRGRIGHSRFFFLSIVLKIFIGSLILGAIRSEPCAVGISKVKEKKHASS